jgi:hypothetical protein
MYYLGGNVSKGVVRAADRTLKWSQMRFQNIQIDPIKED